MSLPAVRLIALAFSACAVLSVVVLVAAEGAPGQAPPQAQPVINPVTLRYHAVPPSVFSGTVDHAGKPATIACGTCHATRQPDPGNHVTADLDIFHQGLQIAHGGNTCLSCHDRTDYDSLHLANGTKVAFADAMELCSQCHGPQRRDWDRGAHGGMNGYWDFSRGGRVRNTCIQCHDPHVPKYQGAIPMPPPRDRFIAAPAGVSHE